MSAPEDTASTASCVAFEPSRKPVEFNALTDTEFVLGSAAPHRYDLILGYYSVHTTPDALRDGEAHICSIRKGMARVTD